MDGENFARFPYQSFDYTESFQQLQGATGVGSYMTLLAGEQEERENACNYYGSQIFTSQAINEEPASRSISPVRNSSTADASAAAAQKKKTV